MGFADEGLVTDAMDKAKIELGCNTEDDVIIAISQSHLCSNTVQMSASLAEAREEHFEAIRIITAQTSPLSVRMENRRHKTKWE